MLEKGCAAIDLCGAFGNEGVARICKAVDRKIPVGAVNFDFHPVFRDKSGDDLFQKRLLVHWTLIIYLIIYL